MRVMYTYVLGIVTGEVGRNEPGNGFSDESNRDFGDVLGRSSDNGKRSDRPCVDHPRPPYSSLRADTFGPAQIGRVPVYSRHQAAAALHERTFYYVRALFRCFLNRPPPQISSFFHQFFRLAARIRLTVQRVNYVPLYGKRVVDKAERN